MAVCALQPLKNLNVSHNGVLAREGLSFERSRVILRVDYISRADSSAVAMFESTVGL